MQGQRSTLKTTILFASLFCMVLCLVGCMPSVKGVVLDADSKTPVQGAEVKFWNKSSTKSVTEPNGFFKTKKYFSLFCFLLPVDVFIYQITITHPDYGLKNGGIPHEIVFSSEVPKLYIHKDARDPNAYLDASEIRSHYPGVYPATRLQPKIE